MNMRYLLIRSACICFMATLLLACTAPTATLVSPTQGNANPDEEQGYPSLPTPENTPLSYPSLVTQPVPTLPPGEAPFRLDKPVAAGATQVTGSGTPEVPIILYNVTFMGAVLGQSTVDGNGRFSVTVPPLEANVRIGVGLGDLAGTRWTADHFLAPGFRGDESTNVPNVGYFLDTVQVTGP
jgi:hypothetical protein